MDIVSSVRHYLVDLNWGKVISLETRNTLRNSVPEMQNCGHDGDSQDLSVHELRENPSELKQTLFEKHMEFFPQQIWLTEEFK